MRTFGQGMGAILLGLTLAFACGGESSKSPSGPAGSPSTSGAPQTAAGSKAGPSGSSGSGSADAGSPPAGSEGGTPSTGGTPLAEGGNSSTEGGTPSTDGGAPVEEPLCHLPCGAGKECRLNASNEAYCFACGGPNQECCKTGKACNDGGCCSAQYCQPESAANATGARCSAGQWSNCGSDGQSCCPTPTEKRSCADANSACVSGAGGGPSADAQCKACGKPGQPCCGGNVCEGEGCCSPAKPGQPQLCVAAGDECANGGKCEAHSCGGCGLADGEPCCNYQGTNGLGRGTCSAPYSICRDIPGEALYTCESCGKKGQRCCEGQFCEGKLSCNLNKCE